MHTEDKLTHEERLRLEALNQAIQSSHVMRPVNAVEEIIARAAKFANWLSTGQEVEIERNKH